MESTTMNIDEFDPSQSRSPEPHAKAFVYIVDDDALVRESLEMLICLSGWQPMTFASAHEFLSHPRACAPSCLILDIGLPDINGLDLQQQIAESYHPPIIFLTGRGDVATSVRAIKAGAFDFLTKPCHPLKLRNLVRIALDHDCECRSEQTELDSLQRCFKSLTPRERQVLPLVVSGLLNKQAAAHLGISEVTLQIHRTNVMRKMEADSLPDLVRIAGHLNIAVTHDRHL